MGYEYRYDQYDLLIDRTPPLVERSLRFTVRERVAVDGQVLTPMQDADVAVVAAALQREAVEAVAIGFMHAYRYPGHEARAKAILAEHLPGVPVCTSAEVSPEIREYERFSTVVANAYIQPLMSGYMHALQDGLRARGIAGPLLLIQSNGGLCDAASAMRYPVRLMESGPAGGAIFAAAIAAELGLDQALLLDVGGTTAKLCFVDGGQPHKAAGMEVGRVDRFPRRQRLAAALSRGGVVRDRGWRRIAGPHRSAWAAAGGAAQRRVGAGPGVLWPRRQRGDGDGCGSRAWASGPPPVRRWHDPLGPGGRGGGYRDSRRGTA